MRAGLALASALALGGCSLLIDTDPYQGDRDGGQGDAGPDADGGFSAPSTPVVRIRPESPVSTDDLEMEIATESLDPLDAGPIAYRIEWRRGEAATDISTATVAAAETAKGEVWTVRVTPIAAGDREGAAGTASVTIGNLPPTLGSAGLSHYRPVEGEALEVVTAGLLDGDGDPTSVTCTWLLDGAPIPDEQARRLVLDERFPPGSRIKAQVTPRDVDGAEGESVETGEALVLEDTVRFRQLAPERSYAFGGGAVVYDAPHRRALLIQYDEEAPHVRLWEYALLESGGRWIELHPSGTEPALVFPSVVVDEPNHRLLFIGATGELTTTLGPLAVSALDLSVRGGERWQSLSPTGTPPSGRILPSVGADPERDRVLLYGGVVPSGSEAAALTDLHTLDIPAPGAEAWTRVELSASGPQVVGATVLVDPGRDRGLLVGGATAELGAIDSIYTLDLNDLADGVSASGTLLPVALLGAASFVDTSADRALIAWGGTGPATGWTVSSAIYELSLETLEVSALSGSAASPSGGFHGFLAADRYAPGRLIANTGGAVPLGTEVSLYATDRAASAFTPVEVMGVTVPRAVQGAFASADRDGLLLFGGRDSQVTDQVWRFGAAGWTATTAAADVASGRSPGARLGASIPRFEGAMWVFGGRTDTEDAEGTVWMLRPTAAGAAEWVERPVPSADIVPGSQESPFDVSCASEGFGLFHGGNSNDVSLFQCNAGGCSWSALAVPGTRPSIRSGAAVSAVGSEVVLFGGSRQSDVWLLEPCLPVPAWTAITPTGEAPPGRLDHRMLLLPEAEAGVDRWLVHGGRDNSGALSDAWLLIREAGAFRWEPLALPAGDPVPDGRAHHALVWDAARSRVLVYGGTTAGFSASARSDLWELRFPTTP